MAISEEWTAPFQHPAGVVIRGVAAAVLWAVLIELALRALPIEVFTWVGIAYPLRWTVRWVWPVEWQ